MEKCLLNTQTDLTVEEDGAVGRRARGGGYVAVLRLKSGVALQLLLLCIHFLLHSLHTGIVQWEEV